VSGAVAALAGLAFQPGRPATSRANSCSASAPRTRAPRGPRRASTCRRASSSSGSSSGPDSSSALRCRKLRGSNVALSTRASRVRRLGGIVSRGERSQAISCRVGKRDGEGFPDWVNSECVQKNDNVGIGGKVGRIVHLQLPFVQRTRSRPLYVCSARKAWKSATRSSGRA
jgi:hypothetical protein